MCFKDSLSKFAKLGLSPSQSSQSLSISDWWMIGPSTKKFKTKLRIEFFKSLILFMDLHILYCLYNISQFFLCVFLLINGWKVSDPDCISVNCLSRKWIWFHLYFNLIKWLTWEKRQEKKLKPVLGTEYFYTFKDLA